MKKVLAIVGVLIGIIIAVSVFITLNTGQFNKYAELNDLKQTSAVSFIKRDVIAKSWAGLAKTQRDISLKISKNLKKSESGNYLLSLFVSIGLAFIYGAIHSIGPGHGKTIIMSYFLSEKARLIDAPILAFQTSGVHILSAIITVFLLNITLNQVLTVGYDKDYWVKIISYSLITVVGLLLLFKKIFSKKIEESSLSLNRITLPIAAGMVPCTGALLILLVSMANNMFFAGIMLVSAVGLGIMTTLSIVGIVTMLTKKIVTMETIFTKGQNIAVTLEYIGVFIIITLGIVMLTLTVSG